MAISKAVTQYAAENGYKFYVQSLGYRKLVEILDTDNKHIGWTSNKSDCARNSINALINQKRLAALSDDAIADEAIEVIADLLPPVANDEVYLELQPVATAPDRRRFYERPSYLGIGVEVYCGDERYGYALAELLDRPVDHPIPTYTSRDTFGDDAFVFSARYGCGALI
jgi:hypothetical protein